MEFENWDLKSYPNVGHHSFSPGSGVINFARLWRKFSPSRKFLFYDNKVNDNRTEESLSIFEWRRQSTFMKPRTCLTRNLISLHCWTVTKRHFTENKFCRKIKSLYVENFVGVLVATWFALTRLRPSSTGFGCKGMALNQEFPLKSGAKF